ncbi:MAG: MotA/TolQ/ExbB proton channel family protein [bacterium]|nr:MotA/TolQ/ExbB proton channel family protein [bacterium]MCP5068268.1 MotA/TolQ/ExbB proton channel family protein [bacterium]
MEEQPILQQAVSGDSASVASSLEQALEMLRLGGPVMMVLAVVSVVGLAIVLIKLYQFWSLQVGARHFATEAIASWRAGRMQEAVQILAASRSPLARVLEVAIRGKHRAGSSDYVLREEVARVGALHLERLRSYLRALEAIATLSPLLGLLGTVLGMIEAFRQLEHAGNRASPAILSGGIWEALLTTAVGLSVAIPAVAALNWLEGRVGRLGHAMEDAATSVFTAELVGEMPQDDRAKSLRPARVQGAD